MDRQRILVVDDEAALRRLVSGVLKEKGCTVDVAGSAEEGLALLEKDEPGVALVDIKLPGMSGLDMLDRIKQLAPNTEVVLMTGHVSVETAIDAIRKGAYDYLRKPFEEIEDVWNVVKRALEKRQLYLKNCELLVEKERRNREMAVAMTRLKSLIDAGCAMGNCQSLDELFDFFINLVVQELDVERASLMLLDPQSKVLRIAASQGLVDVDVDAVRVPLGEGVAGAVAKTGQPFLVKDAESDPRVSKISNAKWAGSFISTPIVLSVPIKAQGTVLGVLNVTDRHSGKPFDEADLSYLSGLSGQVAVAIDRARNFEKLQAAYESVKAAQEKLVASEKIKALGQMAAGVAHDFNNALSIIMGKAQIEIDKIADGTVDSQSLSGTLETIMKVSSRVAERIKRIQDYTRIRKDVADGPVDINAVIKEALEMTKPKWFEESKAQGRPINVRMELTEVLPVSGNVYELTQVLENLIFNAAEAMPQGGELTFRTYAEGNSIVLQVSDTGIGMDEETRERLFEPFFTTKEGGQGLGSSIIYSIVERHDGEIAIDSKPGEGSTFTLRFPRPQSISFGASRAEVQARDTVRPVRILLVDDDELVLETYEEGLSLKGHQVVVAHSGSEALVALDKEGFDVMITDLSMQGMAGLELAEKAKKIKPNLPIILLSGWAIQHAENKIKQVGIDYIVPKPCSIEELGDTIQEATRAGVMPAIG